MRLTIGFGEGNPEGGDVHGFQGPECSVLMPEYRASGSRGLADVVGGEEQARLFLTVIGLALFGIACQNPVQSPPTFQDKFNQIRLESNETSGMTLPGGIFRYRPGFSCQRPCTNH